MSSLSPFDEAVKKAKERSTVLKSINPKLPAAPAKPVPVTPAPLPGGVRS